MKTTSQFRRAGGAALLLLVPLAARASSIDDSAGRVIVPYVVEEDGLASRVQVTNHESVPIEVRAFWVGARNGPHPGKRTCTTLSLPGLTMLPVDVRSQCGLSAAAGVGMLVLIEDAPETARISARAIVDARSSPTMGMGNLLQTVSVAGLPLANLEGTQSALTAGGLRTWSAMTPSPAARSLLTDCYVGSFFDGSGTGGMLATLTLEDSDGNPLGSTATSLNPFELVRFEDVFGNMGIFSAHEGVQAEFVFNGKNDAVVGYCVTTQEGMVKKDRTIVLSMGQVADPQDGVRRREFVATQTPARGPFLMLPPPFNAKQLHGLYVRHPDVVRCSVVADISPFPPPTPPPTLPFATELAIAAFSPDRVRLAGSTSVEFATDVHGTVAGGVSELWGLEVDWPAGTTPPVPSVPYRISCTSGNGTSLADLLVPVAP